MSLSKLLANGYYYLPENGHFISGNGNLLSFIDNYNAAVQLSKAKELEDKQQEAHEIAAAAIRNNKSHFYHKVNGRVIDFESPRNR
jgi:hypothetical protein